MTLNATETLESALDALADGQYDCCRRLLVDLGMHINEGGDPPRLNRHRWHGLIAVLLFTNQMVHERKDT